jgi:hypothetical protein
MVKYKLTCSENHFFEAWFPTIDAFDEQKSRGLVACPVCQTKNVRKAIMAPNLKKESKDSFRVQPAASPSEMAPEQIRELMKGLRKHIAENYDYVGDKFADEARAIHESGETERLIYGETTQLEARELIEEGINIAPLPPLASPKGDKRLN